MKINSLVRLYVNAYKLFIVIFVSLYGQLELQAAIYPLSRRSSSSSSSSSPLGLSPSGSFSSVNMLENPKVTSIIKWMNEHKGADPATRAQRAAATKIQALFRGNLARKRFENMKKYNQLLEKDMADLQTQSWLLPEVKLQVSKKTPEDPSEKVPVPISKADMPLPPSKYKSPAQQIAEERVKAYIKKLNNENNLDLLNAQRTEHENHIENLKSQLGKIYDISDINAPHKPSLEAALVDRNNLLVAVNDQIRTLSPVVSNLKTRGRGKVVNLQTPLIMPPPPPLPPKR